MIRLNEIRFLYHSALKPIPLSKQLPCSLHGGH